MAGACIVIVVGVPLALGSVPAAAAPACTITGTPGPDRLTGTPHADVICGRGGADVIAGGGGNDRLVGGPGDDTLRGGIGNDMLLGGPGNDRLIGGSGVDRISGGAGRNTCLDSSAARVSGCSRSRRSTKPAPPPAPPPPFPPLAPLIPPDELDTSPPDLLSLSFSNENVEIGYGDWWTELRLGAWDESGVKSIDLQIEGPEGSWREVSFGEGPETTEDRQRLDVPTSTPVGVYRVTQATLVDALGNSTTYGLVWLEEHGQAAQFEVYDGPDREAPNLVGLRFEPEPVDTSEGPVNVQVPIEAIDSGTGIERVRLVVENPTNEPGLPRVYTSFPSLVSGTAREGTWLATIALPSGAVHGFYPVERLELKDFEHHWHVYNAEMLEWAHFPGGFEQSGPGDVTKPLVTSFSIQPQVIHGDEGERKIEVDVGASDNWSGVAVWPDPVGRIDFAMVPPGSPFGWGMSGDTPQLVSGTNLDGVWHFDRWLKEEAPNGPWTVSWISVTDRAGNTEKLEGASLEEFEKEGWDLSFENLP